mmetsp:Transcript_34702/g.91959  ORF Transcript_34702/g.91959 Transcript_34702/m.91959 type:complete len:256 (+) Transcript_34702:1078-1845(+)
MRPDGGDLLGAQVVAAPPPHGVEHSKVQLARVTAVADPHAVVHVDINVCLVDDLVLQDLLNDVLQCEHAHHLKARLRGILRVHGSHDAHVGAALFEHGQNLDELCVLEEGLDLAREDVDEVADQHLVLGVSEHQVLCVEQAAVVVLVPTVDRDAAETSLEDLANCIEAQTRLAVEHVGVLQGRHHLVDQLVPEAERALGHLLRQLALLRVAGAHGDLQLQHLDELRPAVDRAHLVPKEAVQDHAHRLREDVEQAD